MRNANEADLLIHTFFNGGEGARREPMFAPGEERRAKRKAKRQQRRRKKARNANRGRS